LDAEGFDQEPPENMVESRSDRQPAWQSGRMQIGMIGLGRMGANMVRRLRDGGHDCVVYDVSADAVAAMEGEGFAGASSLADFVAKLAAPRSVWVMIPAAFVTDTLADLVPLLDADDTIIDGGNSWYHLDVDRSKELAPQGIHYVDVGTSGGVAGLERGYCLMIGGDDTAVARLEPIFDTLAPGVDAAPRTPGRTGDVTSEEQGWLHCGPSGSGHFVKMVHNGIEYGLMAALGEGLNVLAKANIGREEHEKDAETAPLDSADYYKYDIDLAKVTEVWRRGSVITSWLLDLTAEAFLEDPALSAYSGNVSDSGEGRWTIAAAIDEGVPVPVLSAALYQRFSSRGRDDMANKVLSAMRAGFGGHKERQDSTR
jgi:6-phosphogluconate dehydrogenase